MTIIGYQIIDYFYTETFRAQGLQTQVDSQITEPKPVADTIDKNVPVAQHLRDRFGTQFFRIGIVYQGSLESGERCPSATTATNASVA